MHSNASVNAVRSQDLKGGWGRGEDEAVEVFPRLCIVQPWWEYHRKVLRSSSPAPVGVQRQRNTSGASTPNVR